MKQNANCGMHVNIDLANFGQDRETQLECARKLYYVINKHYSFFKVAFNRYTRSTTYCGQCRDRQRIKMADESYLYSMPDDHYQCMNYSHIRTGRLEIRLVGGQKNFATFRNTMETIFHLLSAVQKLSWSDLDDLSKVFKGCNSYVFDRLTKCRNEMVMTDDDIEKIRPTVKEVSYI